LNWPDETPAIGDCHMHVLDQPTACRGWRNHVAAQRSSLKWDEPPGNPVAPNDIDRV
jgi:hypothetical protein